MAVFRTEDRREDALSLPTGMRSKLNLWQNLIKFAKDKPLGAFGGAVAIILIVLAIIAPLVATHDPELTDYRAVLAEPSTEMLLGGDQIGRDVFSRLIYGTRISLLVGILSVLFGVTIGLAVGLVSGYFGGVVDLAAQRVMDAVMAFPALILALSIMAVMGRQSLT